MSVPHNVDELIRRVGEWNIKVRLARLERDVHRVTALENAVDDLERKLRELTIDHQALARRAKVRKGKR